MGVQAKGLRVSAVTLGLIALCPLGQCWGACPSFHTALQRHAGAVAGRDRADLLLLLLLLATTQISHHHLPQVSTPTIYTNTISMSVEYVPLYRGPTAVFRDLCARMECWNTRSGLDELTNDWTSCSGLTPTRNWASLVL